MPENYKTFGFALASVPGVTWREAQPERVRRGDAWQVEVDERDPSSVNPRLRLRRYRIALVGDRPWVPSSSNNFPGVPTTVVPAGAGVTLAAVRAAIAAKVAKSNTEDQLPAYTEATVHDADGPRTLWLIDIGLSDTFVRPT